MCSVVTLLVPLYDIYIYICKIPPSPAAEETGGARLDISGHVLISGTTKQV